MSSQELIFISYRRSDSLAATGRIYDHMTRRFGKNSVFRDANDISPGVDFNQRLKQALSECHVLLVIIGHTWLTASVGNGSRRLDDPDDYVRMEVELSLARDIPIIPVLLDGTAMPKPSDLPVSIQNLAYQHATPVGQDHLFEQHMERLIESVWERLLKRRKTFIRSSKHPYRFSYREYVYRNKSILIRAIRRLFKREILKIGEHKDQVIDQITWQLGSGKEVLELVSIPFQNASDGSFFIGKYPISQRQWRVISSFSGNKLPSDPSHFKGDDRPVESITWDEANTYCKTLSDITNRTFRLPSMAEWQRACRAGSKGSSPYGLGHNRVHIVSAENAYQRSDGSSTRALFNYSGMSEPYWPNSFGLYHMLGNVSEWCSDNWYIGDTQEFSRLSSAQGENCINRKVACGGSFIHPRSMLGSETFDGEDSTLRLEYVGFRVVMEVSQ